MTYILSGGALNSTHSLLTVGIFIISLKIVSDITASLPCGCSS